MKSTKMNPINIKEDKKKFTIIEHIKAKYPLFRREYVVFYHISKQTKYFK